MVKSMKVTIINAINSGRCVVTNSVTSYTACATVRTAICTQLLLSAAHMYHHNRKQLFVYVQA
jgi:hypothetical protein